MKKQITAFALSLVMAVNFMPTMTASATNEQKTELKMPKTQTKTFILPAENISTSDGVGDVKVEVTYTGWLGEIDAKENGLDGSIGSNNWISGSNNADNTKIAVLKEDSEIRFKITSNDPNAYYNYCYDNIAYDYGFGDDALYGWDDCGGGYLYYSAENDGFPVQVYGQPNGTSILQAGPFDNYFAEGRKISVNEYSYKVVNGLMEYTFHSKYPRDDDNSYNPNDWICSYFLGTVLAINDEQVKELEETGTMTFLKGVMAMGEHSVEYQHVYKGLPELLGTSSTEETTYGQAIAKFKGYTIDENNIGRLLIDVTNTGTKPDEGDLFYVLYCKFIESIGMTDAGIFVPNDIIRKIHYEVEPNSTKTLAIEVGMLGDTGEKLTEEQIANGWSKMENVEDSRCVLAQAETPEEAEELTAFFKRIHNYGEMQLSETPDEYGVTELAAPYSNKRNREYLDQKLSMFTSKF